MKKRTKTCACRIRSGNKELTEELLQELRVRQPARKPRTGKSPKVLPTGRVLSRVLSETGVLSGVLWSSGECSGGCPTAPRFPRGSLAGQQTSNRRDHSTLKGRRSKLEGRQRRAERKRISEGSGTHAANWRQLHYRGQSQQESRQSQLNEPPSNPTLGGAQITFVIRKLIKV